MRNKLLYYMLAIFLLSIVGCSQEEIQLSRQIEQEGEEVSVRFSVDIPDYKTVHTRANGGVNDLYLLVFDQNGSMVARRLATLSNQTDQGGNFTANLPASASPRVVHFISNYDWANFNDQLNIGVNEAAVVALMSTSNATLWKREVLSNGISSTTFNGQTIELLRNQSKISVTNQATNFTYNGFAVHNAPDKGTVAPFNTSTSMFDEGTITEPSGVTLLSAQQNDVSMTEKFLFERKNANASSITTVIIKGDFSGQTYYYKIDLIDANKNRYDIQRNYHYAVKIKTVTRAGYSSFEDALTGASHNNAALDPIIEKYPIISDGTRKLEVEKTLVVLTTAGQTFQVWTKYYPNISSTTVDNSSTVVTIESNNEAIDAGTLSFDNSTNGIISAKGNSPMPSEPKESRIRVTNGDLARVIRVVQRNPFIFTPVTINGANPGSVANSQGRDADLKFNIPSDFPADLLPHPIKISAQGLYPASSGMEMVVENGIMSYIYRATATGEQTINFKTNKSNITETVKIEAEYFTNASVEYITNASTNVIGNITYGTSSSQSDVQSGTVVSASTGSITVDSNGRFIYVPPTSYNNTTQVVFTYKRGMGNYSQEYEYTTTINALVSSKNIAMILGYYIFEGTIKYTQGNTSDVPSNGTVSIQSGGGNIQMNGTGNYIYRVSASTSDDTSIQFRYIRWTSTYNQTKTISQLKSNSSLVLTR